MSKTLRQIREEAAAVNVGSGNIAGAGIDKPGKPGSGEPGVDKRKKGTIAILKRNLPQGVK
jgi:hypothetical protein